MKFKKLNLDILLFAISIICIISFSAIIVNDNELIDEELYMAAHEEAEQIKERIKLFLESDIEESVEDILLISEYISKNNINEYNVMEYFNSQSHVEEFEELFYINLQGEGISIEEEERNFANNSVFLDALEKDIVISLSTIMPNSIDKKITLAVPIVKDGETTAVLLSSHSIDEIYVYMQKMFEDKGGALIIDNNFNVVLSTVDEDDEMLKIYYQLVGMGNNVFSEKLREDFLKKECGSFRYEVNGESQIIAYTNIAPSDLNLVVNVQLKKFYVGLNDAITTIVRVSMAIVFMLLIFTLYTWYSKTSLLKTVEKNAYYDPLTMLPNLSKLKKDMTEILNRNPKKLYTIIKMDIENFKAINEMFSFEVGNKVLKTFTEVREAINEPSMIVARTGTDEFIFFAENEILKDIDEERLLYESYYKRIIPELGDYRLSFKYGRYFIEQGEMDVDAIVTKVGLAHSVSKVSKGKVIHDYDNDYKKQIVESAEITNKMKPALANKEFKIYLQPKFSLKENKLIGAEALVRWIEDDGNMIFPDKFIGLFEKNGFIVELDKYMIELSCKTIRDWIDRGIGYLPIAVNCSRLNLDNANFVNDIAAIVDKYNLPREYIEIELTESTMIENEELLEKLFTDLKEHGFKVSIDDFGCGFSSLGLLKNFKADTLKLDRNFFINTKDIVRGDLVVDGIVKLAQSLNMHVVAEGIEAREQVEFLKSIGCDAVQGYFFGKPTGVKEFEEKFYNEISKTEIIFKNDSVISSSVNRNDTKKVDMIISVLNAIKVPANIFNSKFNELRCNIKNIELFGLDNLEQWQTEFFNLSPEFQPDGQLSLPLIIENVNDAKKNGFKKFHWMHRNLNNEEIPCEVVISKLNILSDSGEELYIGVITDLRDQLSTFQEDNDTDNIINEGIFFNRITDKALFNIVNELSDELFFNYDVLGGKIQFFGKGSQEMQLSQNIHSFNLLDSVRELVHTEDIEIFNDFIEAMRNGEEKHWVIRLNQPDGEVGHFKFIYKSVINEDGVTAFAVGKAYDISEQKKLEVLAKKDLLTNCYNKISTEKIIERIISTQEDVSHALFIVDIDDFKGINDNLGHIFGDNVLREISKKMHEYFREGDILGRIGGDEFVIFLKNINNIRVLKEKAEAIIQVFQNSYTGETKDYKVSGSVGVALYPENGKTYEELFVAADSALYQSKLKGKDCYTFYEEEFQGGTMRNLTILENVGRIADAYFDANFVSNIFELLYEMKTRDTSMETVLEVIGKHLSVDRCYIFESLNKGESYTETYEWCKEGIKPKKHRYQNIPRKYFRELEEEVLEKGIFYCNDISAMKTEESRTIMKKSNVKSMLLIQIKNMQPDFVRILIGFDDCEEHRVWTEKEINSVRYILKMISLFILSSENT